MLSELNSRFEAGQACLDPAVWREWLWGCDLAEAMSVDCLLNRAHLLGLLIARVRAQCEPESMDVLITLPHMVHQNTQISSMTPRQLKDAIEDLQAHWFRYAEDDLDAVTVHVDACMARFGSLLLLPHGYDDVGMRDSADASRMSVMCMRRLITVLCVLYRHLDLLHRWAEPPSEANGALEEIQEFHVQSSSDLFHTLMMHSDLPPGARCLYRQDFTGFYHCVSQVVYFHFPSYQRRPQLDLAAVRTGESAIHTLAPISEMYPEINVCYEDEAPKKGVWNWIIMGKRVYLMDPTQEAVFYSPNLLHSMRAFR